MGQTAADTQREIAALRREITEAASELDRRVTRMLDVKARMNDASAYAQRLVEERPQVVAGVGAGLALGVILLTARSHGAKKKRQAEAARREAWRQSAQGQAAQRIENAIGQARELLATGGVQLAALSATGSEHTRSSDSEPSMIKKFLWTALMAGSLALAGLLARKFSTSLWQAVMHEEPPSATS